MRLFKTKEEKLAEIKRELAELDNLSDEEFMKIMEETYGKAFANIALSYGMPQLARTMIKQKLEKRIEELEWELNQKEIGE